MLQNRRLNEYIVFLGSSGGVVVKFVPCRARGTGFDSRSRATISEFGLSPASKSRSD